MTPEFQPYSSELHAEITNDARIKMTLSEYDEAGSVYKYFLDENDPMAILEAMNETVSVTFQDGVTLRSLILALSPWHAILGKIGVCDYKAISEVAEQIQSETSKYKQIDVYADVNPNSNDHDRARIHFAPQDKPEEGRNGEELCCGSFAEIIDLPIVFYNKAMDKLEQIEDSRDITLGFSNALVHNFIYDIKVVHEAHLKNAPSFKL